MERVLVTGASKIGQAGVATMVFRWGQEFDSNKIIYDYLMQSGLPSQNYQDAIKKKGGRIYTIKNGSKNMLSIIIWVENIIRKNKYKTIHINSDSSYLAAAYIFAAKKAKTENIVVHSHCSYIDDSNWIRRNIRILLHKICKPYVVKYAKYYLACSKEAGLWMYSEDGIRSNKFHVLYTSENIDDFYYNEQRRKRFRLKYNLDNKLLLGNIGRFSFQKNHDFLLDVFQNFREKYDNACLLLVGNGPLKAKIVEKVNRMNLDDSVIFMQDRNDIPDIYNSIDIFVMTSLFEGMPATIVEAQMSFLPCVVSWDVTHDVKFTDNVEFVKGWDINIWVKAIENYLYAERKLDKKILYESDFNIVNTSKRLTEILLN